jgi:16S rRNA (adenine(1408)-N(1))-methyltransferase
VGTGDGRYPLYVARTRPDAFAIGIEPSLDGLRRTARSLARRPMNNIALLAESAESACLGPLGDEVTVHFPWGSLLDAVLGEAPHALAAAASLAKPGGRVRVIVSATDRDGRPPLSLDRVSSLAPSYRDVGLCIETIRPATRADIVAARSSWGKRLDAGHTRPAFVIEAARR